MSMTIGPRVTQPTVMMPGAGFASETPGARSALFPGESLRVTEGKTSATEGVGREIEADITRDDWIGRMFAGVFNFPAPAVPEELKGWKVER